MNIYNTFFKNYEYSNSWKYCANTQNYEQNYKLLKLKALQGTTIAFLDSLIFFFYKINIKILKNERSKMP